jgi:hypothetical protein
MTDDNAFPDFNSTAQSERDFIMALKSLILEPEQVNLNQLWQVIEKLLQQLPDLEQLRIGGTVMTLLAEIHSAKADRFLMDWEERHNDKGPVMEEDLLAGLVQRTMHLDLTDLIAPKTKALRKASTDSVAKPVEKKQVLKMLEQMENEEITKKQALSIAHDENISAWGQAIAQWFEEMNKQSEGQETLLCHLQLKLAQRDQSLTPIKVWLALLLGGYELEQRGNFYDVDTIWVKGTNVSP